jgi:ribokinase
MSTQRPKVVVIGGTYIDMAFRCARIPTEGQDLAGSELCYKTTGPGPNQATQAVKCGCEVHLVGKVGGDPFASMVKQDLTELKINTAYIYTAEAKNTGVIITMVDSQGENATCHYAGANSALQGNDIEQAEEVISQANLCLIHGQLPREAIITALKLAQIHGVRVILNPAHPLDQRTTNLPIEYFSADVLIPNLYEAADITEQSTANIRTAKLIGSDLVARGVEYAIITMDRRGCMLIDRSGAEQIPSFEIDLVDDTGCGDAFAGALAAYCAVKSNDMKNAVYFAAAAGALACSKFGSIESLPGKADIIQLLQEQDR